MLQNEPKQKGLILGQFAPLHLGHQFLIRDAQQKCPNLTILITSRAEDPIPGWQRYHWVKNSFPELDVRHLIGTHTPDAETVRRNIPENLTFLFESGATQARLAQNLGLEHVEIDPERKNFPISGTSILENPQAYGELLPQIVQSFFVTRIALVGPESCGKSYLAEQLAAHFKTVFVEEYGRTYCEKFGMDSTDLDFAHVAGGQLYREDVMALQANRLLFCDTDLIVTQVWSEVYFKGKCQPWIYWADHSRRYALFLLCAPDIPWVNDGLREYEAQREWMFERLQQELESRGLRYEIIRGGFEARTAAAIAAVELLLA